MSALLSQRDIVIRSLRGRKDLTPRELGAACGGLRRYAAVRHPVSSGRSGQKGTVPPGLSFF
jgi:hypothetical protein